MPLTSEGRRADTADLSAEKLQNRLRHVERALVIGCAGSGKSTLAAQLAPRLALPVIHLDALFWQPGWVPTAPPEWDAVVAALAAEPRWLIEGDYGRTLPLRLARADLVVWLDLATGTCLWRVLRRALWRRDVVRPDMAAGCPERLDWGLLRWVAGYRRRRRPSIVHWRSDAPVHQIWVTLTSTAAVSHWLAALNATDAQGDPGISTRC